VACDQPVRTDCHAAGTNKIDVEVSVSATGEDIAVRHRDLEGARTEVVERKVVGDDAPLSMMRWKKVPGGGLRKRGKAVVARRCLRVGRVQNGGR